MGSSGGGPTPPAIPDPSTVSNAQNAANVAAYSTNLQGQSGGWNTPYGGEQFTQTGTTAQGTPIYSTSQYYSPQQMELLGLSEQGAGTMGALGNNLLGNTFAQYSTPPNLLQGAGSLTNQMMGSELSSLQPYFNTQDEQLQAQLTAEGLAAPGSLPTSPGGAGAGNQAYANAFDQLQGSQNQAINSFLASAYPQAFSMAESNYELPAQMAESFLSQAQPAAASNLTPSQIPFLSDTLQPNNVIGAYGTIGGLQQQEYTTQLQQQEAQAADLANLVGSIAQAGGTAAGGYLKSDRRLKEGIKRIGTADNGLALYIFRYKGDSVPHIGFMADEVQKVHPEAVHKVFGYLAVDYDQAVI